MKSKEEVKKRTYAFRKYRCEENTSMADIFNYFIENRFFVYPEERMGRKFTDNLIKMVKKHPIYIIETAKKK